MDFSIMSTNDLLYTFANANQQVTGEYLTGETYALLTGIVESAKTELLRRADATKYYRAGMTRREARAFKAGYAAAQEYYEVLMRHRPSIAADQGEENARS